MFLAIRELSFARLRFALMGAVIALIAVLDGDAVRAVGRAGPRRRVRAAEPAGHLVRLRAGVQQDSAFSRSVVDASAVDTWAPSRASRTRRRSATRSSTRVPTGEPRSTWRCSASQPDSFLSPSVSQGDRLGTGGRDRGEPHRAGRGPADGRHVTVDRLGTRLRVVGVTEQQDTFGHVDVAYVPLAAWQAIKSGTPPDARVAAARRNGDHCGGGPRGRREVPRPGRRRHRRGHREPDPEGVLRRLAGLHRRDDDACN